MEIMLGSCTPQKSCTRNCPTPSHQHCHTPSSPTQTSPITHLSLVGGPFLLPAPPPLLHLILLQTLVLHALQEEPGVDVGLLQQVLQTKVTLLLRHAQELLHLKESRMKENEKCMNSGGEKRKRNGGGKNHKRNGR